MRVKTATLHVIMSISYQVSAASPLVWRERSVQNKCRVPLRALQREAEFRQARRCVAAKRHAPITPSRGTIEAVGASQESSLHELRPCGRVVGVAAAVAAACKFCTSWNKSACRCSNGAVARCTTALIANSICSCVVMAISEAPRGSSCTAPSGMRQVVEDRSAGAVA